MFPWFTGLIGLLTFLSAVAMLLFRWWLTDLVLWATLWGACAGIAGGATALWALRKNNGTEPAHRVQRNQAKAAILFSAVAVILIYGLMFAAKPTEKPTPNGQKSPPRTTQDAT
jgi:hypothetical protein